MKYFLAHYESGATVPLEASQLGQAEDLLVTHYLPSIMRNSSPNLELAQLTWDHRTRLLDELRGKKFIGNLIDLSLTALPEPEHALLEANIHPYRSRTPEALAANCIGFIVTGRFSSSRAADAGDLFKPVWIIRGNNNNVTSNGKLWRRYVGPNLSHDRTDELHRTSVGNARRLQVSTGNTRAASKHVTLDDGQHKAN